MIYYHSVSDRNLPHLHYMIRMKSSQEMQKDLEYLSKKYDFISVSDFLNSTNHDSKRKPELILTFDDGYHELYDIVQPILLRMGIPAVIFIPSNFLDNCELFYRCKISIIRDRLQHDKDLRNSLNSKVEQLSSSLTSNYDIKTALRRMNYGDSRLIDEIAELLGIDFQEYLTKNTPYLTSGQVKDLLHNGFEIGAHSIDHPFYGRIPLQEQLKQSIESLDLISSKYSLPYRYFALPHSDHGITEAYFQKMKTHADIILGGYGKLAFSEYRYYQRFSIEKYAVSPSAAWHCERLKVDLKARFEHPHVLAAANYQKEK